jgi:hypothetical protein
LLLDFESERDVCGHLEGTFPAALGAFDVMHYTGLVAEHATELHNA